MKKISTTVDGLLLRMRTYFQGESVLKKIYKDEEPLRSELFSAWQMQKHGANVASRHKVMDGKNSDKLLKRLDKNEGVLLQVRDLLVDAVKEKLPLTPASEWLLDNFYLIEEQISIGRKHLPKGYSQNLPHLATGATTGYPRVYDIALEIISHSDGRVDLINLSSFIEAYQKVSNLTLGELWAIPIMLRLALIENLRRVAVSTALDRIDQNIANYWAGLLMDVAQRQPKDIILTVADMARTKPILSSSFVAEFTRRLQGKGSGLSLPLNWVDQQLSETGYTSSELIHMENQTQAADQVSMRNSIESLRLLRTTEWRDFVERISSVDRALNEDELYAQMDFTTRDTYRHVIESIAQKSTKSETEIAEIAIALSRQSKELKEDYRKRHVGYYLIDKGIGATQKAAAMKCTFLDRLTSFFSGHVLFYYSGGIIFGTSAICIAVSGFAYTQGVHTLLIIAIFLLSFMGGSQLVISIANWLVTLMVRPRVLPKMDYAKGIPDEAATLIAIPCMLTHLTSIEELSEALEVRYLANPHPNLYFALVADYKDARTATTPQDAALLAHAIENIESLNRKYHREPPQEGEADIFYLFQRDRVWSARQRCWMGLERKRGKLGALNEFLLNRDGTGDFSSITGDYKHLPVIKYVITLDADTQLPREAAAKMISTIAHPLNKPLYDLKKQRVVAGHGILQPRVAVTLPKSNSSIFVRMHSMDSGLDPYTRVSSDVYQDLYDEGSFIGKGIYQVDVFEEALSNRFPENRILSHDLLEGCYLRSGLISDVDLYEDFPQSYLIDSSRKHRWIRGDWQIASWAMPWVPNKENRLKKNRLSGLSRWKIADNIRRSLVAPALVLLLFLGWVLLPYPWFWTTCVAAVFILPILLNSLWHLIHKPKDVDVKPHIREFAIKTYDNFLKELFYIACLPYEAWLNMDAIIRTNWRMIFSNKHLLEWTPSGSLKGNNHKTVLQTYRLMWSAPFISLVFGAVILYFTFNGFLVAIPVLLLWIAAPMVSWYTSKPKKQKSALLDEEDLIFLHVIARKTWSYFESFVTKAENWLPPDNYQQEPKPAIAHRTSPTNMGLALLANLSAYDFGYITGFTFLERTRQTLETMDQLEKYHRHFYNWYDTLSLMPMPPKYISAVDSGNLAGHLITLRQGLLQLPFQKIIQENFFEGLRDTLHLVTDEVLESEDNSLSVLFKRIHELCEKTDTPRRLTEYYNVLMELQELADKVNKQQHKTIPESALAMQPLTQKVAGIGAVEYLPPLAAVPPAASSPARETEVQVVPMDGMISFRQQTHAALEEINDLAPWIGNMYLSRFSALNFLEDNVHLYRLKNYRKDVPDLIDQLIQETRDPLVQQELIQIKDHILDGAKKAGERVERIIAQADVCQRLSDMDYDFLYDRSKHLLRIGYNVQEHLADNSYYDLLASEARLGIYVAIAQGKLPQDAWFALGRLLTGGGTTPVLLSWSGSMFEYLMPQLVMPTYENTLIEQTSKGMIRRQISFAVKRSVPWGISESGFNTVDASLNYQYRAFGVPGLGLKRGLGDDLVIAPYASMLALMIQPVQACDNLREMADMGYEGAFGFYEAVDYTASRLPRGQSEAVVRSFMVHHQGMSFLSLAYLLLNRKMQERFEADPQFQSALLLLQEKIPKATIFYSHTPDLTQTSPAAEQGQMRILNTPHTTQPEVKLLSNGHYHVMISNAGGGYSKWKDLAITRWREDGTLDNWGVFCYIKDLEDNLFWSNTHQPTLNPTKRYEAVFSQGHAEFRRRDNDFETRTEIVVSPEDNVEVRRVRVTNRHSSAREIEITSYAEVVLAPQAADEAHPAFSNLFVETEFRESEQAILCTRRSRSSSEQPPWMFHLMSVSGAESQSISFETDRMKFIGRSRSVASPAALDLAGPLGGNAGSVLDPIVAIRHRVSLKPNQTATFDLVIGVADKKTVCEGLLYKYQDRHLKNRAFELSWTHSQVLLRQINATEAEAQLYGRMAGSILYPNATLRAAPSIINSNLKTQSGLWSYSISGDLPIVLLRVQSEENIGLIRQMINAHIYWRLKGVKADLIIWNENFGTYRQELQDQIQSLIALANSVSLNEQYGGIFLRSSDQIASEDRILIQTVARIIIDDNLGTLEEQITRKTVAKLLPPPLLSSQNNTGASARQSAQVASSRPLPSNLTFDNGFGGFTEDGKEYIIRINREQHTPTPWSNVLANKDFGTVISESGSAYTWSGNAHEYRLTPWKNDPVSDSCGEAIYIRDEETGVCWSPTALPMATKGDYITRHGYGYSVFEHTENGIETSLWVFVDTEKSVKFQQLKLINVSGRERKLKVTGYVEWVLGDLAGKNAMYVVTEKVPDRSGVMAFNRYSSSYPGQVCFFDADGKDNSITADRTDFLGRNGRLAFPAALTRTKLSGKTGAALDPCAAIQVPVSLYPKEEKEVVFRLGSAPDKAAAIALIESVKGPEAAGAALKRVHALWNETLGQTKVLTPDNALNHLANGWLTYQTLGCRIWGRSGYYQSGGAFGFRDQLQDVLALLENRPDIAREQILLSSSRQFKEGDVQHWWHPPTGRGVRTLCSDDYLWLPFVTAQYVFTTGDHSILTEITPFLEGRLLNENEDSYYDLPIISEQKDTLYEHCLRSIRHGLRMGVHGLPLMGTGDWNDGMDKVGEEGKGESVWLGFFLYSVLMQFKDIARDHQDTATVELCEHEGAILKENIQQNGWDGGWYRRAYFDDGTPLGSAQNKECQIDSIAQSWSVLSGAGAPDRKNVAMAALQRHLVRPKEGIILLLDPAFDKSELNPGYIKGYAPGVRENGGQYTHAAVWAMMAFAEMGMADVVWRLFSMINPIAHTFNREAVEVYKVEPYVMAADVYNAPQHKGRGGWTWYTGSAGWMQQFMTKFILGIRRSGNRLTFKPCTPAQWPSFKVTYAFGKAVYEIEVFTSSAEERIYIIDGITSQDPFITLVDDAGPVTYNVVVK